jgi:polysaccharide chain length determinant protein (PEP-CTERM system associated)
VLPGKRYTPEEIARIAGRRAWLIVIPLAVCTAAALVIGKHLPKQYRSETLIMVIPQRIPQSYVKAGGTENIEDRLATLQDQILSRSRLERIVVDLNLYEALRRTLPMEDVVQRMRADVTIETTIPKGDNKDSASFRIKYMGNDARTVQKTTERLASLFIEENLRDRANVAEDTTQFLESQLEDARQRLVEQEKKLEAYRRKYSGELPSQATSDMQAVQTLQMQLQTLGDATDRARERHLLLERQLADLELPDPTVAVAAPASSTSTSDTPPVATTAQQLDAARTRLQALLLHDTPEHPDVRAMERTIRGLEAKQRAESAAAENSAPAPVEKITTTAEALKEKRRRDLKAELAVLDRELLDKQEQEVRLHQQVADYQAKLDAMPSRESDLVALTRDYTTLQTTYQSLLLKREESKVAANLERLNIGEQFKVLDPSRVAEKPFRPNLVAITGGGAAGGLALGVLIVVALEYRNRSLGTEDDVVRLCQLPVLGLIPRMVTDAERRAEKRRMLVVNAAGALVVLGAAAIVALSILRL